MDLGVSVISTSILLLFVLDPFGNVPILLSVLKDVEHKRRRRIIIREMLYGLAILLFFLFFGGSFLNLFHLETEAVTIAGGVILFIIGLRMIFPPGAGENPYGFVGEPYIVPIAMPLTAGPSALATLLVMTQSRHHTMLELFLAVLLAWFVTTVILYLAPLLYRLLGNKGLQALEKLMGMLLLIMSVQMFINGVRGFLAHSKL